MVGQIDTILQTVSRPDRREEDLVPGRERFTAQIASDLGRDIAVVPGRASPSPEARGRSRCCAMGRTRLGPLGTCSI